MEELRLNYEIEIAFRQFPLHPETPAEGVTLEQLFAGRNLDIPAMQAQMAQRMAEEGLPYGDRTMTYNSRLAQELAKWAETQPGGQGIHDALFQAYFVGGVNLAEIDELVAIAVELGLSADEALRVLTEREFRDAVDADWQRSRSLGVTGVPTFVMGERGMVGAQPYEQLAAFVESAGVARRPRG